MNIEHVEVLERLRGVLEHGKMGDKCLIAPDLVTAAIAALSAQPPAEAQPVACAHEAWEEIAGWNRCVDCGHGWASASPPSAPVGVEGLPEKWRREAPRARVDVGEDASLAWREAVYWCAFQLEAALAQQPAAVDGVEKLTEQQAVIVTGYTGILCGSFGAFHADLEKRAGRSVLTHEMDDFGWIKTLYRDDFIALAGQQQGGPQE